MLASRNTYTWIQKYIFPGGLIPSVEAIVGITERETRLRTVGMLSLRPHYAETLRLWRERFTEHREAVSALGFDDVVPADVGALPGLLRGRLPVRLPRRLPVDVRTDGRGQMSFLVVSAASLAILVLVYGITFLVGRRIGRYNVVDVTWGAQLRRGGGRRRRRSATATCFRRLLLLALVAVWGLRLAWHMVGKSAGKGEDPRYDQLLKGDFSALNVLRKIFLIQAVAAWFISLPLQLSAALGPTPTALLPVLIAGVVVWVVGVLFEAVGDHQLREFKADPANKGMIMDRGLWAWTRHPNYFGDAAVWWGLWLITIAGWLSLATVLSPVAMTYFLVYATGARLTEKNHGRPARASANTARAHHFSCPVRLDRE